MPSAQATSQHTEDPLTLSASSAFLVHTDVCLLLVPVLVPTNDSNHRSLQMVSTGGAYYSCLLVVSTNGACWRCLYLSSGTLRQAIPLLQANNYQAESYKTGLQTIEHDMSMYAECST